MGSFCAAVVFALAPVPVYLDFRWQARYGPDYYRDLRNIISKATLLSFTARVRVTNVMILTTPSRVMCDAEVAEKA